MRNRDARFLAALRGWFWAFAFTQRSRAGLQYVAASRLELGGNGASTVMQNARKDGHLRL